ncbi:MAG: DUF4366 domain-containing protein [Mobilitalea sp.]
MKKSKVFGCLLAVFFYAMTSTSIVYAVDGEAETETAEVLKPETTSTTAVEQTEISEVTSIPMLEQTEILEVEITKMPTAETTKGTPFSEEGNVVTRDLLYDAATNKQFLTIETRNGTLFYVVIDYDKPVNEKGEQYETYFLNMVDERDLLDLVEVETESTPIVCSCTKHCELGAVNTECPLCVQDIKNCVGKEEVTTEPVELEAPTEKGTNQTSSLLLVVLLLLVLVGGGVFAYLKLGKEKRRSKVPNSLEDYGFDDEEEEIEVYEEDTEVETEDEEK